jgi:hypothetical protein
MFRSQLLEKGKRVRHKYKAERTIPRYGRDNKKLFCRLQRHKILWTKDRVVIIWVTGKKATTFNFSSPVSRLPFPCLSCPWLYQSRQARSTRCGNTRRYDPIEETQIPDRKSRSAYICFSLQHVSCWTNRISQRAPVAHAVAMPLWQFALWHSRIDLKRDLLDYEAQMDHLGLSSAFMICASLWMVLLNWYLGQCWSNLWNSLVMINYRLDWLLFIWNVLQSSLAVINLLNMADPNGNPWSEWIFHHEYNRYYRYRYDRTTGKPEYQYRAQTNLGQWVDY